MIMVVQQALLMLVVQRALPILVVQLALLVLVVNLTSLRYSSCLSAAAHSGNNKNDLNTTINSDVCCVCYHTFEHDQREGNRLEWMQYICEKWLHEEVINKAQQYKFNFREAFLG